MKVEVAVSGSPSLISLMVFVDVKQHRTALTHTRQSSLTVKVDSGGHLWLPVPNKPDGFCGRTATLKRPAGTEAEGPSRRLFLFQKPLLIGGHWKTVNPSGSFHDTTVVCGASSYARTTIWSKYPAFA